MPLRTMWANVHNHRDVPYFFKWGLFTLITRLCLLFTFVRKLSSLALALRMHCFRTGLLHGR